MIPDNVKDINPLKNKLATEISKDVYSKRLHINSLVMIACLAVAFTGYGKYTESRENTRQEINELKQTVEVLEIRVNRLEQNK